MSDVNFNFFNLIKKCCVKLDLDVPIDFVETQEPEYVKLKEAINSINRTIVLSEVERWSFRDQIIYIPLIAGVDQYERPDGMITSIRYEIDEKTLTNPLIPEYRWNYLNKSEGRPSRYNLYGDRLLLYPTPTNTENGKRLIVKFATNNCAKSVSEVLKPNMELKTDYSLIPPQFSDVLIYGACMDYKSMPDKSKYQHYQTMYTSTLRQMRRQQKRSLELEAYNDVEGAGSSDDWVQEFFNSWKNV